MIDRRTLLLGTAGLAVNPYAIWEAVAHGDETGNNADLELLAEIGDLVIPATDTPGARGANVAQFVALALQHHLNDAAPDTLAILRSTLDAGVPFLSLAAAQRFAALEALDVAAYAPVSPAGAPGDKYAAWRTVKGLVLMGYYTSEVGATQELRYQFVPGRFDGDVPFAPGERALANDWWGNLF